MNNLAGIRILNTRPPQQAAELTANLTALGATVIELPLIEIAPTQQWKKQNIDIHAFKYIIFTSPNAVTYFFDNTQTKQSVTTSTIIAIGAGTSRALLKYGLVSISPEEPSSEGLLRLSELQTITGISILLVKGVGGRTYLPQTLKLRGAKLKVLQVYRRKRPETVASTLKDLWQRDALDMIVITSATMLRHLFGCLEDNRMREWLIKKPFFVISDRIARSFRHKNIQTMIVTRYDHLLHALRDFAHERRH
jgi:uroporphyrinogen-III synthase